MLSESWERRPGGPSCFVMRYKIEFLKDSTDATSVCFHVFSPGPLEVAKREAAELGRTEMLESADGVQIRDFNDGAGIVWLKHFDA